MIFFIQMGSKICKKLCLLLTTQSNFDRRDSCIRVHCVRRLSRAGKKRIALTPSWQFALNSVMLWFLYFTFNTSAQRKRDVGKRRETGEQSGGLEQTNIYFPSSIRPLETSLHFELQSVNLSVGPEPAPLSPVNGLRGGAHARVFVHYKEKHDEHFGIWLADEYLNTTNLLSVRSSRCSLDSLSIIHTACTVCLFVCVWIKSDFFFMSIGNRKRDWCRFVDQ